MRSSSAQAVLIVYLSFFPAENDIVSRDFESDSPGRVPRGWLVEKSRERPGGVWRVLDDSSAPSGKLVLAQISSNGADQQFNLCVFDGAKFADVALSVRLKPQTGRNDQGGGVVWRYRDARNYYVCRWNPLENNFRLYKVLDGKRSQMDTAKVKADSRDWHTLRVVHVGREIRCSLDGTLLLEAENDEIAAPGRVGLWTKSDAVTRFDDFSAGSGAATDVEELQ